MPAGSLPARTHSDKSRTDAHPAELILQKAAEDGSFDAAEWPETLQYILHQLDQIVNDFPKPTISPADSPSSAANTPSRPRNALSSQESATTDKENAPPATPPRPAVPAFSTDADLQGFPQETINFYSSVRTLLTKNFANAPPYTIQRLAELILEPKRRYRFLPAYLRALDRVVNVSSPTTLFPLPQAVLPTTGGLLNGTTSTPSLGSDEALGGALLSPIPWLQNRGSQNELVSESTQMVDGPHGTGRIETVTVAMLNGNGATTTTSPTSPSSSSSGQAQIASSHPDGETLPSTGPVTQGELLRQEQEAGIVLNNPHSLTNHPSRTTIGETEEANTVIETVESQEETPHARGPEVIGMEDTGPQKQSGGLDIEGAVGRPSIDRSSKSPQPPASTEADSKD
ncbi:hypothetical protein BDV95DRAFT_525776, partial [Massariosphaeria phaeospora]